MLGLFTDSQQSSKTEISRRWRLVSVDKVRFDREKRKSTSSMDTNLFNSNSTTSCAVPCAENSSNMLLACNAPTANLLATSNATGKSSPNVYHSRMPRQIQMKARLIIAYLIVGPASPTLEPIGAVIAVICYLLVKQTVVNVESVHSLVTRTVHTLCLISVACLWRKPT